MKPSFSSNLFRIGLVALAAGLGPACESDDLEDGVGGAGAGDGTAIANGGTDSAAGAGGSAGGEGSEGGAGGGDVEAGAAGGGGKSGALRVMALGDSVTRATCWRALLWEKLNQSFASRFDFVGTLGSSDGCSPAGYDPRKWQMPGTRRSSPSSESCVRNARAMDIAERHRAFDMTAT